MQKLNRPAGPCIDESKLQCIVDQAESAGSAADPGSVRNLPRRTTDAVKRRYSDAVKRRYSGSSAEHLWTRLDAMDFINKGMLFAAVLLLCFFPFLIIANALAGQSAVTGLTRRLGLNQEAATRCKPPIRLLDIDLKRRYWNCLRLLHTGWDRCCCRCPRPLRAGLRARLQGSEGHYSPIHLVMFCRRRGVRYRLGRALAAVVRWARAPWSRWPDGPDHLLVVHNVVPVGGKNFVVSSTALGHCHRDLLDRHGSRLFVHFLQHRDR